MKYLDTILNCLLLVSIAAILLSILKIYKYFLNKNKKLQFGGINFLYRVIEYCELTKKEDGKVGIWIYILVVSILLGFFVTLSQFLIT